jgi:hypothetical protein
MRHGHDPAGDYVDARPLTPDAGPLLPALPASCSHMSWP